MSVLEWIAIPPYATVLIVAVAFVMSILYSATNRVIISHFIGWDKYRAIQKEMTEFRKESMAAARSNDKKQLEKVKKKQAQINAMQAQIMKPQMIQMGLSFCYLPLFFVLRSFFGDADLAFLPGFKLNYFYWYPIASFFCASLMMRIMGTMPIE